MFDDRYGLTQAVIEGRKTMTRRLVPWDLTEQWMEFVSDAPSVGGVYVHESEKDFYEREAPRYKVGEVVAVAQSYETAGFDPEYRIEGGLYAKKHAGWRNKMFVSAKYMPHQIRITGVRCERLQDITDAECLKEGIIWDEADLEYDTYEFYDYAGNSDDGFDTPREAFASLIDKVSGCGTWASNPWVVVYEFELVK